MLALLVLGSGGTHASSSTVLLAWPPSAEATAYDVYGVEGSETYLGSTDANAFVAPGGFSSYVVKFHAADGEQRVSTICVRPNPEELRVTIDPDC